MFGVELFKNNDKHMRCKNCGWENDPGAIRCDKCNAPLNGSMGSSDREIRDPQVDKPLKKTVRESDSINPIHENGLKKCPHCGYLYNSDMSVCPNCGKGDKQQENLSREEPSHGKPDDGMVVCPTCHETVPSKFNFCANCGQPLGKHTFNPWARPQNSEKECSLTPMPWEGEESSVQSQKYTGKSIILNRGNTDPDNNSITSKEQAVLTFENGAWFIEDKSQQQTTYLHVGKKMQIEDGDIIILGNRRFVFKG